jgi:carboxyl-terminal processing protease
MFASWSRDRAEQVRRAHAVLDQLGPEDRLIIDVRPNGGGDELLAREIAGRFVDRPVVYAKNRNRDASLPGGFTPVHERRLKPSGKGAAFKGKIAVLMGPVNMGSCEAFLLMMRQVPGCKLIGTRSYGSSGNPQPVELANGVTVYLPSWQAMDAEGNLIEGKGIEPDIQVAWKPGGGDPVIEAALRYLAQ